MRSLLESMFVLKGPPHTVYPRSGGGGEVSTTRLNIYLRTSKFKITSAQNWHEKASKQTDFDSLLCPLIEDYHGTSKTEWGAHLDIAVTADIG